MIALRRRLRLDQAPDAGLTLIEVLVAMTIFGFIAVGVALGLTASMRAAVDNQQRITAASLASAEIDRVRAIGDPFDVNDVDPGVAAGPDNAFTVLTKTSWDPAGSDATCGTSGGPLKYKIVKVTVSWTGMRAPVTSTTLIAPSGRINDQTMGTILVSVKNRDGRGSAGVSFTAKSSTTTLTTEATDSDGCSYVLKVPPGSYTVTLNQTGYIDYQQKAAPAKTSPVAAGAATSYSFQYDKAANISLGYGTPAPKLPTTLDATFINATYGGAFPPTAISTATNLVKLHPYKDGYQVVAGVYDDTTCPVTNPLEWAPDTSKSPARVGTLAAPVTVDPGAAATLPVQTGWATVSPGTDGTYLTAVGQNVQPVAGEPACSTTKTYAFSNIIPSSGGGVRIALPFGSWKLYASTTSGGTTKALTGGRVTIGSNGAYESSSGLLTLDPRQ